ncbi:alpha/beta fold hydrolase [uncultured Zhongshania sp.]|jgi:predicted alpha/beta hydrolase|uniref:alpha/beta hydrolase family protein n=1 Tax=uncultured Zhongshania sp. TaxID=1642288 RepID=UPI0025CFBA6C|nr:alpha/beta fold hydrolase [uncultured Zhongshania sp.]
MNNQAPADEDVQLKCEDGTYLDANISRPAAGMPLHGSVVIAGALGVPRRFYQALANFLSSNGYAVLRFDYRGIEGSGPSQRGRDVRLYDWGRYDIDAALAAGQKLSSDRHFMIGHSCGGQLLGLAPSAAHLDGAIFVASTLANPDLYPAPARYGLRMMWNAIIPLVSFGRDRFPARRLGFSNVDIPSGVMSEWARWARGDAYLFSQRFGLDLSRYSALNIPLLSFSFEDDGYASVAAISGLLDKFPACVVENRYFARGELPIGKIGHFGFFRDKAKETLWQQTLDWLWLESNPQKVVAAHENASTPSADQTP